MSAKTPSDFAGVWRIVQTELWEADLRDLVVPARITFFEDGFGRLEVAVIRASIDCEFEDDLVQFSWQGHDHGRPACGRGEAAIKDGALYGKLYIHEGSETWFVARRSEIGAACEVTSSRDGV